MNTKDFEELIFLYHAYGKEDVTNLTEDAILLKYKVIQFIKELPCLPLELNNGEDK